MADVQRRPVRSPSQRAEDCSTVAHNFSKTCVLDAKMRHSRLRDPKFSSPTCTHAAPQLHADEAELMQNLRYNLLTAKIAAGRAK